MKAMLLATPVQGYLACCEALSTLDQRALLPKIKSPTLVIAGRHDMATPLAAGELIRSQIPARQPHDSRRRAYFQCRAAARLHRRRGRFPDATLTMAQEIRTSIPSRLEGRHTMDDQKRRDDGMVQRRKVLGDAWVDKSITNRNAFNTDFQDMITRYAWGEIWTRPHFDERTRRVLVIGTMVALGAMGRIPPARARGARRKAASRPTISRKFCCSRRSIAACPPPTTPSRKPQRLFRSWGC